MIPSQKSIVLWLFSGCSLIWAMVVVGGITRLTHSGLSMVNWSVFGNFPPHTPDQWQSAFDAYKTSPEYKLINSYFSIDDFKSIYWWEYIHRTIGRIIGMVFILPFLYFLLKDKIKGNLLFKLLVILALGGLQGLLGWYMVKSGLVNEPHVSHLRLAAHLITAFVTFGFTFWVALDIIYLKPEVRSQKSEFKILKRWSYLLLFFVFLQIIYGAFTAGLRAGQFDPTFPKMGNSWIAPEVTSMSPIWVNFINGVAGVQFIHRYNAYIVVLLVISIWYKSRKMNLYPSQKNGIYFLVGMVLLQFLLGVFTLINSVPVLLGVLHQTGAFLLFASTLFVIHQWKTGISDNSNKL
jgi:heme a synthase